MRLLTWMVLVGLAVAAVTIGHPGWALAFAGAKALLVGAEFMELKHAHRAHGVLFGGGVVGLVAVLVVLIGR